MPVGRVVFLKAGPHTGHMAVILKSLTTTRQSLTAPPPAFHVKLSHTDTSPSRFLPFQTFRSSGIVKKYLEKADTVSKWESSAWAKKRAAAATNTYRL
ncbi:hypothetical protein EDB84DRAFT_95632 [Lactarius hengduanensis]|nr:hypothetical protein EDB84DRAFT_95632 [Lactarius hengduanensis]